MCDTIVVVRPGEVLFAKNSDRDANEAQHLDWQPARNHAARATLPCTWLEIPQVRRTHAVLLSRPFWTWGAEIGTNEHGVTIGNEAVFTRSGVPKIGLTGMDLVRLGLERSQTAEEAVEIICSLIAKHGQGGRCGFDHAAFRYFSSFIIADPEGAFILETSKDAKAVVSVQGAASISNALSIPEFARVHRDPLRDWAGQSAQRRQRTSSAAAVATGVADLMHALRDHGHGPWPHYAPLQGTLGAPCMHGGSPISAVTTSSWVSRLTLGGHEHWATATGAPCLGLFKPVAVDAPVEMGPLPTATFDDRTLFWAHEELARTAMRDPERLAQPWLAERRHRAPLAEASSRLASRF